MKGKRKSKGALDKQQGLLEYGNVEMFWDFFCVAIQNFMNNEIFRHSVYSIREKERFMTNGFGKRTK